MVDHQNSPRTNEPPDSEGNSDLPNQLLQESEIDNEWICPSLQQPAAGPFDSVLIVTSSHSVDDVINWSDRYTGEQGKLGIISVGDSVRSTTAAATPSGAVGSASFTVIPSPRSLDALGVAIDDHLKALTGNGAPVTVCFEALDSLLEHTHQVRVLRFIGGTMERCHNANVTAHYHVNPAKHDARIVDHLESLFQHQPVVH